MIAIATLSDWLKRLAPVFQSMRSKSKTIRTMYAKGTRTVILDVTATRHDVSYFFQQISQEISSEGQISADDELSVEDLMKKLKSI